MVIPLFTCQWDLAMLPIGDTLNELQLSGLWKTLIFAMREKDLRGREYRSCVSYLSSQENKTCQKRFCFNGIRTYDLNNFTEWVLCPLSYQANLALVALCDTTYANRDFKEQQCGRWRGRHKIRWNPKGQLRMTRGRLQSTTDASLIALHRSSISITSATRGKSRLWKWSSDRHSSSFKSLKFSKVRNHRVGRDY